MARAADKVAEAVAAAWFITCPHCGEGLTGADGSYLVKADEPILSSTRVTCFDCFKPYRLPVKARKGP